MKANIIFLCFVFMAAVAAPGHAAANSVKSAVYPGPATQKAEKMTAAPELVSLNSVANAFIIKLDELEPDILEAIGSNDSPRRRIGVARAITESNGGSLKIRLNWQQHQGGGHLSSIILKSPGAKAIRIAMIMDGLPPEAEFRFFEPKIGDEIYADLITGEQIINLISLNQASEPDNPETRKYWSPIVNGESFGLEIFLPPDVDPDSFHIDIPSLSHIFEDALSLNLKSLTAEAYGDSNSCQKDATCYSDWIDPRNATAHMTYSDSGDTYICTGTLLNDSDDSTWKPYFISANHCIATQTVASTLVTRWFFESTTCNGSTRNPSYKKITGGAVLLWTKGITTSKNNSSQDVSFFELNEDPPAGVTFAGWDTTTIGAGTKTGVHHPSGDWKKISFGEPGGNYDFYKEGDDDYSYPEDSGNFIRIDWTVGGSEGGSSGSGLFNNQKQYIGTLFGGSGGVCEGSDKYFSKFSVAYSVGNLSRWLGQGMQCSFSISPISKTYSSDGGNHLVSVDASSSTCSWTASENLSWVSLSSTSGIGSGDITVSVDANAGPARTGSVAIAGETHTISQGAIPIAVAVDNTSLTWTSNSSVEWHGQSSTYYYGGSAIQSGDIGDEHTTDISTTVTGPGKVAFYWKVSSEQSYDFLRFYIDGVKKDEISGDTEWEEKEYSIGPGTHTLTWAYEKDDSISANSDSGFVDKIVLSALKSTVAPIIELLLLD